MFSASFPYFIKEGAVIDEQHITYNKMEHCRNLPAVFTNKWLLDHDHYFLRCIDGHLHVGSFHLGSFLNGIDSYIPRYLLLRKEKFLDV